MKIRIDILQGGTHRSDLSGHLYVNDIRCATVQVFPSTELIEVTTTDLAGDKLLCEADEYCRSLYRVKAENEQVRFVPMDLDEYIRDLVKIKTLDMESEENIIFGKENDYQKWVLFPPMKLLLGSTTGEILLSQIIKNFIVPKLTGDNRIWQNNLPDHIINIVGKQHFHDRQPRYIRKEHLRILFDPSHKKGGPKR